MVEQLLKYQEVDEKLRTIEDSIKNSEEYKKYANATKFLKTVNDSRAQYEDRSNAMLVSFKEKQDEVNKFLEEQQDLIQSIDEEQVDEKEIAYLNRRVRQLQKRLVALEQEITQLQEDIKSLLGKYSTFAKKTKLAIEQREEYKEKYEKLVKDNEADKMAIQAQLDEIKKGIPDAIMKKYIDKRKDGKSKIVCKVVNGICSSCNTELVIAEMDRLKAEKVMECPNCHKLIYIG